MASSSSEERRHTSTHGSSDSASTLLNEIGKNVDWGCASGHIPIRVKAVRPRPRSLREQANTTSANRSADLSYTDRRDDATADARSGEDGIPPRPPTSSESPAPSIPLFDVSRAPQTHRQTDANMRNGETTTIRTRNKRDGSSIGISKGNQIEQVKSFSNSNSEQTKEKQGYANGATNAEASGGQNSHRLDEEASTLKRTKVGCNCSKTECLRRYCQCFANGELCDRSICKCTGCANCQENKEGRQRAIERVKRRGGAGVFNSEEKVAQGCNCRRGCSKKYCVCIKMGRTCVDGLCRCNSCSNCTKHDDAEHPPLNTLTAHTKPTIARNGVSLAYLQPLEGASSAFTAAEPQRGFEWPPLPCPPWEMGPPMPPPPLAGPKRAAGMTSFFSASKSGRAPKAPKAENHSLPSGILSSLNVIPPTEEEKSKRMIAHNDGLACNEDLPQWL